jgi:hypothetical protein
MFNAGQGGNITVGRESELVSTSFPYAHGTNLLLCSNCGAVLIRTFPAFNCIVCSTCNCQKHNALFIQFHFISCLPLPGKWRHVIITFRMQFSGLVWIRYTLIFKFLNFFFSSWTIYFINIYVKTNKCINYYSVYWLCKVAATCFGFILPSSGSVPRAFWEMCSIEVQSIKYYGWVCCV